MGRVEAFLLVVVALVAMSSCGGTESSISTGQAGSATTGPVGVSATSTPGTVGGSVTSIAPTVPVRQLTAEEWRAQANKACRDFRERMGNLKLPQAARDETPEQARAFDDVLAQYVADFEALQPPSSQAEINAAIVDALKRKRSISGAYSEAAGQGVDPSEADGEAMAKANTDFLEAVGRGLLEDCLHGG